MIDFQPQSQWAWMMDYCRRKRIPPAQSWAWDQALRAYEKEHKEDEALVKHKEQSDE